MIERGFFIALEGIDGSGKTTLAKSIARTLKAMRGKVTSLRAPGGTNTGEMIRSLVVSKTNLSWSTRAEIFLFMADRAEACSKIIAPALAKRHVVICDRFTGSTLAYQGYGRGEDVETLALVEEFSRGEVSPDLTLLIDIDPAQAAMRRGDRMNSSGEGATRFENEEVEFLQRVHEGYRRLAARYDWTVIDGSRSEEEVLQDALSAMSRVMGIDLCSVREGFVD